MSDDIKWEDPPPSARGGTAANRRWEGRFAALRERPGQWANFGEYSGGMATHLNQGHVAGVTKDEFEVVGRNPRVIGGRRRIDLYARYVGKPNLKATAS